MNGKKKEKIKAVIFDMDNTLFDFVKAKLKACRAVVELAGGSDEMELLEYFLDAPGGFEDKGSIAGYLKGKDRYTDDLYKQCRTIYDETKINNISPYKGIKETLAHLRQRGLKLAVVTDASWNDATGRLEKAGLRSFFDIIISADMTGKRKPETDGVALALEKLGTKAWEAMIVGDSLARDITPGKKLGLVTVHAVYGDRNFREDGNVTADLRIEAPEELLDLITKDNVTKKEDDSIQAP